MTTFDDREQAFEAKFANDQAAQFRATARRNKLLGLWAAELMGITGDDAEAYGKEVVTSDFEEVGDDDVFRKVRGDLDARNVDKSDEEIRAQMTELMIVAKEQLANED